MISEANVTNNKEYTVYLHIVPRSLSGYNWDKYYVGITSIAIKERWGKNGTGYHSQSYFWMAIQKYGWDNIEHEIIAEHLTKDEACNFEKKLISLLQSNISIYGYNLTSGGEGNSICDHLNVCQYDLDGNFISVYPNALEACRTLGLKCNSKSIYKCCRGEFKTAYGFQWRFLDKDKGIINKIPPCVDYKPVNQEVYQYDLNGNFINKYTSIAQAAKAINGFTSNIVLCCQGKQKTHKGFQWFYTYQGKDCNKKVNIGNRISVFVYDLEGNFVGSFISFTDAKIKLNLNGRPSKKIGKYPENDCAYCGYRFFTEYYTKIPSYNKQKGRRKSNGNIK